MSKKAIRFFNDREVRAVWDDENNCWWFSATDVVRAINDEPDFYDNRSTNASAESINSKIKAFRAKLHGVNDSKFFIFRLCNIYA